jgi:DNA-binding LytR/AlgR family response regulator
MASENGRVLLHLGRDLRRVIEVDDIYSLEATGETTRVRLRSAKELRDTRSLGELLAVVSAFGIVRVHRNHAVTLSHVAEIRRRDGEADWELTMAPPVNRVLPVSRAQLKPLWAAFGEGRRRPAARRRR